MTPKQIYERIRVNYRDAFQELMRPFFVTLASPNFLDEPSETSFESFCTRKSSNKFGFSLVFS